MIKPIKIDYNLTRQLNKQKKELEKKKFFENLPEKYTPPADLPGCAIIDIDGTLAKRVNRGPYEFDRVGEDDIQAQTRFIANLVKRDKQLIVIIVSGREDKYRIITEKWLKDFEVEYDFLFMRKTEDRRPDYIVKKEIFDTEIRNKYAVFFAVEDRKQVKKMWVSLGIFVFDVNQTDVVF